MKSFIAVSLTAFQTADARSTWFKERECPTWSEETYNALRLDTAQWMQGTRQWYQIQQEGYNLGECATAEWRQTDPDYEDLYQAIYRGTGEDLWYWPFPSNEVQNYFYKDGATFVPTSSFAGIHSSRMPYLKVVDTDYVNYAIYYNCEEYFYGLRTDETFVIWVRDPTNASALSAAQAKLKESPFDFDIAASEESVLVKHENCDYTWTT